MRFLQESALRVALALCLLFGAGQAQAAVSLDNCEAARFVLSGNPITDSGFTVGAGSNQLLVVLISQANSLGTPSATWNGVSLTSAATLTNGSVRTDILVLKAPAQGNQSLIYSSSAGFSFSTAIACSFNGVDQTTPTQNANTSTGTTIAVTTASGNETVMAGATSGSFTAIDNIQLYADNSNGTGAARQDSSSGSTTYTPTFSGTKSLVGVDIKAAAAAAGCTTHRLGLLVVENIHETPL